MLYYNISPEVEAFSTMRDDELPYPVVQAHQTHGDRVARIDGWTERVDLEGIDAMITDVPGLAIGVRTADCIPVLMYDPVHRAVAAVHSGWKGTVKKISAKAVAAMTENYGTDPADLKVAIGPGIGPESFEVGPEVVDAFRDAGFPMDKIVTYYNKAHVDLWEACRLTLVEAGVKADNIRISGICTRTDERFFSARREGISCGRIINAIRMRQP